MQVETSILSSQTSSLELLNHHPHTYTLTRKHYHTLMTSTQRILILIALIAAWAATLGSLYFSEILNFIPCSLCWYQRILMYPLAVILLVGLIRRDEGIFYYVLPFSVIGVILSTYHYLLQKTDIFTSSAVCDTGIPCTTTWINLLGFITIPFLALIAFLIISVMGALFFLDESELEG